MAKPLAGGGTGWERAFAAMGKECMATTRAFAFHRHEPKMAGKVRVQGGLPDYGAVYCGRAILIECKHESGASMPLGRLIGEDSEAGGGVKPSQARVMDRHLEADTLIFIAARLEVPATTLARHRQRALIGPSPELAPSVQRLILWEDWRNLMEAAENARFYKATPKASIPAEELDTMGWPLRNARELLEALDVWCDGVVDMVRPEEGATDPIVTVNGRTVSLDEARRILEAIP